MFATHFFLCALPIEFSFDKLRIINTKMRMIDRSIDTMENMTCVCVGFDILNRSFVYLFVYPVNTDLTHVYHIYLSLELFPGESSKRQPQYIPTELDWTVNCNHMIAINHFVFTSVS